MASGSSQASNWWTPQLPSGIPLPTWHDVLHAHNRYLAVFERQPKTKDPIPTAAIPDACGTETMVPWLVEAPFSSVEVLEAILKPPEPLQIYTAKHIHRGCVTHPTHPNSEYDRKRNFPRNKRRYQEYSRFQGRLEKDREISFVCIPRPSTHVIHDAVCRLGCWTVCLFYTSIPWRIKEQNSHLEHPWAIVPRCRPIPCDPRFDYENLLEMLLRRLGISGCTFKRSLLRPGTTPLPENILDYWEGMPGSTTALPYYTEEEEEKTGKGQNNGKDEDGENQADATVTIKKEEGLEEEIGDSKPKPKAELIE
ncbi:hypothetical protein FALBO_9810 [Fusarium albosuccineum]|uniref:Uncharacterized protein n=1 Tax=Fusarium albosuccineum TaxID=1237068 RepID=A0A8H4PIU8_9HYPO|nr:hypothetical protein FALBO_9810 [Fusarium albosuccineum]